MNEQRSDIVPGFVKQEAFTTVKKGYDKQQVDEYIWRNHNQLRDSQERLSRSEDEIERLRRDLADAKEKASVKPEHEQVSERMAAILRIAEEEAEAKRSQVEEEIQRIREESTKDSKRLVKDAEAHAERILGSAREQAQELVTSAKHESEQLRAQAQQEADRVLAEAEQRAQRIHDTADHRLATLTATHTEAVRRLNDMRSTLGDLLDAESAAGPLEAGLEKSLAEAQEKPGGRTSTPPAGAKPPEGKPVAPAEPSKNAAAAAPGKHDKSASTGNANPVNTGNTGNTGNAGNAGNAGDAGNANAANTGNAANAGNAANTGNAGKTGTADSANGAAMPGTKAGGPNTPPTKAANAAGSSSNKAGDNKPEGSGGKSADAEADIEGPSTVRLGGAPQGSAVRNSPPRPQGFRYDAPAPEEGGTEQTETAASGKTAPADKSGSQSGGDQDPETVVLGSDSGITGVYTRPTEPKSDGEDGPEGVRIV